MENMSLGLRSFVESTNQWMKHFRLYFFTLLAFLGIGIGLTLGMLGIYSIFGNIGIAQVINDAFKEDATKAINTIRIMNALLIQYWPIWLLFFITCLWSMLGFYRVSFDLIDKGHSSPKRALKTIYLLPQALIANMLYVMLITIGLILFIIPGIYWAVRYSFVNSAIVRDNAGVVQAFYTSGKITDGRIWHLIPFFIICVLLNRMDIMTLGLLSMPILTYALSYMYVTLHKESN